MSHWNLLQEFTGCDAVPGKKFAMSSDPEYANSPAKSRPGWCPLIDMGPLTPMAAALVRDYPIYINLLAEKFKTALLDRILHGDPEEEKP